MKQLKLFINNEWVNSKDSKSSESIDPSTNEIIAEFALAGKKDIDRAVKAARKAFNKWSEITPDKRADQLLCAADIMKKRFKELAKWESRDVGKTIYEAENVDIPFAIRAMEYFANLGREVKGEVIPTPDNLTHDYMTYEPYGIIGVIIPWNYPLHIATITIAPALVTGNTVVLKPSSLAPVTCTILGEIFLEAGFPEGVLNIVTGIGDTAGEAILTHPDIDMVSFTGSLEVGRRVVQASSESNLKKVVLELGGKGPFIAESDCNINAAVNSLITGYVLTQGQCCCASTRAYIQENIYDEFMDRLLKKIDSLKIGDPLNQSTQVGSLISESQLNKVDAYVKRAVRDGAKLAYGGKKYTVPPCDKGNYYEPTILTNVENSMECCQEEIFGPVLVVLKYKDLNQAIAMANDNEYALGATIWSENVKTLYWTAKKLNSGIVWMNTNVMSKIETPYGGNNNSGYGRVGGTFGVMEFLKVKNNVLFINEEYDNYYNLD